MELTSMIEKLTCVERFNDTVKIKIHTLDLGSVSESLGLNLTTYFEMTEVIDENESYATFTAIEFLIFVRFMKVPIKRVKFLEVNRKKIYCNTFVYNDQSYTIINYKSTACFM